MNITVWYRRSVWVGTALALLVIVLGAYVRLSDAGLGCPDWPGCYGHLVLPSDLAARTAAQLEFPERILDSGKAWREMAHRYVATALGLVIVMINILAWRNRRTLNDPGRLPLVLLGVVVFQGLLGMWTVTWLLKPLIVMGHLLGGLTTLGLLAWLLHGTHRRHTDRPSARIPWPVVAGLLVLTGQIALGGWTSANYAALACPDVPTCQGQWWPEEANFGDAFVWWRGLGTNYEFGVLDAPSRVAIHFTHRLGALVILGVLGSVAWWARRRFGSVQVTRASNMLLAALVLQIALGAGIVWFGLPLPLAAAHNGEQPCCSSA